MSTPAHDAVAEPLSVLGPRSGYTTQIGFLVSQLNWMRAAVLSRLQGLTAEELDWLPHPEANSIGALLMHLAAADACYGLHTFDSVPWGGFSYEARKKWGVALNLGQTARVRYKGFDLQYYLSHLCQAREHTLAELSKRDDAWLMAVDPLWSWGPTNNLCKWFHVCEHESHHLGQIDLILKQLPGRLSRDKRGLHQGRVSRTALGVALRRAAHQIYDASPSVLDDTIAVPLLGARYAQALADSQEDLHEDMSRTMRAWLVARSRFAEDRLARAVKGGVRQYVLLGAGLDTFAFRNPHPELMVYEVDHPATQSWKKELVEAGRIAVPESLRFVAVDFETEKLSERLEAAGLDADAPTVFAMLGVVMYLTGEAFRETVRYVAGFPEGSGVIFDYAMPRDMLPAEEVDAWDELASRVESIGEPFRLFFSPDAIRGELGAFGSVEDVDDKELDRLYFASRTDQLSLQGRSGRMIAAFRSYL